jgi:hypothetical protein
MDIRMDAPIRLARHLAAANDLDVASPMLRPIYGGRAVHYDHTLTDLRHTILLQVHMKVL